MSLFCRENQENCAHVGAGFGRKQVGDSRSRLERNFILSADGKQLINEIDPEIIEIAGEVIAFAHKIKKSNHA